MNSLLGKKIAQSQVFLENGIRIPVTRIEVLGNEVLALKTKEKNGYCAIQLGFGKKRQLREVRVFDETTLPSVGDLLKATAVFKPGDVVDVIGTSKGKGYAGVVKRHHFKGGPRTHGQSDRERAPGAIGSTTTPGRVYKGKRMAGRMGQDRVTIKNLQVVSVDDNYLLVKGLVPGSLNSLVMIKKVREDKKFVPLYKEVPEASNGEHKSEQAGEEKQNAT